MHTCATRLTPTAGLWQENTAACPAHLGQPGPEGPGGRLGRFVPQCCPPRPRARSPHPHQAGLSAAGAARVSPGDHICCPAGNGGPQAVPGKTIQHLQDGRGSQVPAGLSSMGSGSMAAWHLPLPPMTDRHKVGLASVERGRPGPDPLTKSASFICPQSPWQPSRPTEPASRPTHPRSGRWPSGTQQAP